MKRIQKQQTASQRADEPRRGHTALLVLMLCLALAVGIAISAAVLGGSLSRFSQRGTHVIALAPEERQLKTTVVKDTSREESGAQPKPLERPEAVPGRAAEENDKARAAEFQGNLQVHDGVQYWSSETQVDLFKESYNESGAETVKAGDGKKVIAPGTSNFYAFTLENNSNYPMDYRISLKVAGYGTGSRPEIPLEWRLLAGDGTTVSDWRGYSETAELMEQATLADRRQNNYAIEWRWDFERGGDRDKTDTELGNRAVDQLLGAEATIIVYAEQNTGQDGPSGTSQRPKTGDGSEPGLYIVWMTLSGGGLLILIQSQRRRKKSE